MTKAVLVPRYIEIEIPDDWKIIELKDIVQKHNSGIFKNKELYGSGSNIVGVVDLYDNTSIDGQTFGLVELTDEEKKGKTLVDGDLVYAESSLVRDGIAKTLYVTKRGKGTVFAWHTRRFSLKGEFDPKFVYYQLNSNVIRNSLVSRSTTTALTGITTKDYFRTKIPIPPTINEQKEIASKLLDIDRQIEQTDSVYHQTELLMKGVMQKLLTNGVKKHEKQKQITPFGKQFQKFSIPRIWEVKKLNDLCELITDGSHFSPVKKGIFPLATVTNMEGDYIDIESCYRIGKSDYEQLIKNNCQPKKNDVLFSKDGTIGLCLVYNQPDEIVVLSSIAIIRTNTGQLDPVFLKYILKSRYMQVYLDKFKTGTALKRIILKNLSEFSFPVPLLDEQQKITSILSNLDSLIRQEKHYKEQLKKIKKGMMQKLLTGQVRVKV